MLKKKINLILIFEMTSEFSIQIIDSLIQPWGVHFTWFDCKYVNMLFGLAQTDMYLQKNAL